MKFTQIAVGRWKENANREGYTLFALDGEGRIWKSITKKKSPQHQGWLELTGTTLTEQELTREYRTVLNTQEPHPEEALAESASV